MDCLLSLYFRGLQALAKPNGATCRLSMTEAGAYWLIFSSKDSGLKKRQRNRSMLVIVLC